jgi:hypothetical protein
MVNALALDGQVEFTIHCKVNLGLFQSAEGAFNNAKATLKKRRPFEYKASDPTQKPALQLVVYT